MSGITKEARSIGEEIAAKLLTDTVADMLAIAFGVRIDSLVGEVTRQHRERVEHLERLLAARPKSPGIRGHTQEYRRWSEVVERTLARQEAKVSP